ncbi:hypothetical protein [Aneurinibacillus uraniidurans]|uniref:hypothetical protein n=1 Tax=Aneurinibacillus uraniidurans TaxID=2966586 RepID=UPI0023491C22|nr:hypothetical protein [Aneurinibacillus sp. B1]WCN39556.1 hypothetical protein PO771_09215 [Aneurinibacillus sp. B1]
MTTTQCPIPNPQTCCIYPVEFKTQLVPPALEGSFEVYDVSVDAVIEAVCPEKVIICGKVTKKYKYTSVKQDGTRNPEWRTDERAFQCIIDRDDADEGDPNDYVITGMAVLSKGYASLHNISKMPDINHPGKTVNVFWSFRETDLIKVCIRKRT